MKFFNQMIKFYLVGAIGTGINFGILFLLTEFAQFWYIYSSLIGISIGLTTNFFVNKYWTFKSKTDNINGFFKQYGKYLLVNSLAIILQISILFALVEFFGLWYIVAAVFAIGSTALLNFSLNRYWTFQYKNIRDSEAKLN